MTFTGYTVPTLSEVEAEMQADVLGEVDAGLDLSSESPLGQVVSIFARQITRDRELIGTLYGGIDPNKAEGVLLDNVAAITGTTRLAAKKSLAKCNLSLNATVTVPAGSRISVATQTNVVFELTADVTSTTAGTYTGTFEALVTGPVAANAGTLTNILTPVSGWTAVTNPLDAELGRNVETDTELRVRRAIELAEPGSSSANAIRAGVLNVAGVESCFVYENTSDQTDEFMVPPHAFEVIIWDGLTPQADDQEIFQAIYDNKGGGGQAYGQSVTGYVTDDSGSTIEISFTRAIPVLIYIYVFLTTNKFWDSGTGPSAVKTDLAAYMNSVCGAGTDVVNMKARARPLTFSGVDDVDTCYIGAPGLQIGNIAIDRRHIARFDTSRITVGTS